MNCKCNDIKIDNNCWRATITDERVCKYNSIKCALVNVPETTSIRLLNRKLVVPASIAPTVTKSMVMPAPMPAPMPVYVKTSKFLGEACSRTNHNIIVETNLSHMLNASVEYKCFDKGGGGDCFFLVLSFYMKQLTNLDITVTELRRLVVVHINEQLNNPANTNDDLLALLFSYYNEYNSSLDVPNLRGKQLPEYIVKHILSRNHYASGEEQAYFANLFRFAFITIAPSTMNVSSGIVCIQSTISAPEYYAILDYPIGHYRVGQIIIDKKYMLSYGKISEFKPYENILCTHGSH